MVSSCACSLFVLLCCHLIVPLSFLVSIRLFFLMFLFSSSCLSTLLFLIVILSAPAILSSFAFPFLFLCSFVLLLFVCFTLLASAVCFCSMYSLYCRVFSGVLNTLAVLAWFVFVSVYVVSVSSFFFTNRALCTHPFSPSLLFFLSFSRLR